VIELLKIKMMLKLHQINSYGKYYSTYKHKRTLQYTKIYKSHACPLAKPTERSAIKLSSVSPLLWLTITPHPAAFESRAALIDSVTVPI
jgi:hypothetical protein